MAADIQSDCLINGIQYKCRTCFDPGRTIYSLTEEASNMKTWREVIKDIAQLQINDDEILPKTLCCKCLEKLKKSYDFVLQIQNVNKKYSELLSKEEVSIESDSFNDCLAESAIALPLEEFIPEIKVEDEMAISYNIDMSNNKLEDNDEDNDDPFTETIDDEVDLQASEQLEENESAKTKCGESTAKRNRGKKVKKSVESEELKRSPVKRPKKAKQPKKNAKTSHTDELNELKSTPINEDDDGKETIVCDKCSQTFPTIHTYQRHQQAEHSSESNEEKNKCPICSKEFRNSWYVVDHIKVVHDKLKPYKCSHCPKSFASAHSKRIHELTHTDNFPYACEYCDRRFRLSSKLKIHSEIHTTKPELLCPICKRSQKSQEELEVHIKNHDDNRLQCPSCGNLFRRNAQLKDHYNAVHLKLRPYKCEFCELGFGDRKTRRVHQRTHHKQELSISSLSSNLDEDWNCINFENTYRPSSSEEDDKDVPSRQQPVRKKVRSRSQPFSPDEVIEKINNNCFLCLVCNKTVTYLRNCRRHVANMHMREINWSPNSPTENLSSSKKLHEQTKEFVDSDDSMNENTQNILFGSLIYGKPSAWRLVECKLCNTTFETSKQLRDHLKNHSDIETLHSMKLSDNFVKYIFPNMIDLKLIKESICKDIRNKEWFKYYTVLNKHSYEMSISDTEVDEVEEENPERASKYKCAFCAKEFAFKYQVFSHLKKAHTEEKIPFKCNRCKLEFVSIKMYKQHLKTHCHNMHKLLLCGICPGRFIWPENIKTHNCAARSQEISSANFDDQPKLNVIAIMRCGLCPQSFQKLRNLRKHIFLHADGKTGIDFDNCIYVKQFESSKLIDYEMLQQQIQNDFSKCEISRFYQAIDKYGNEIDLSDSDEDSCTEESNCANTEKKYKCEVCNEMFIKRNYLLRHQHERHETQMPFTCKDCGKQYVSMQLLQQHSKKGYCCQVKGIKALQCELCNIRFIWADSLLRHKEIKHHIMTDAFNLASITSSETGTTATDNFVRRALASDVFDISSDSHQTPKNISKVTVCKQPTTEKETKFFCSYCCVSFSNNSKLREHTMVKHTSEKAFKCTRCSMAFEEEADMQAHRLTHPGEHPFQCLLCTKSFERRSQLKSHNRVHSDSIYKCTICPKSFKKPYRLRNHLRTHTDEKPFKCDFCSKSFLCKVYLKRHREAMGHTELWTNAANGTSVSKNLENPTANLSNKILCPICGVYLSKKTSFTNHMRRHTGDRPFKCDFCEMDYVRKSDLLDHRRSHTDERPHKCPHCDKSFSKRVKLKIHIRTHTGERPYKCTFCNKAFSLAERLKLHTRLHTGEKPYKCDICNQAYACQPYLKKHRIAKGHLVGKM